MSHELHPIMEKALAPFINMTDKEDVPMDELNKDKPEAIKKIKDEIWLAIPSVTEEVNEYEYRGDRGDYTPTENERVLMEDFGHGIVEEIVNKVAELIWKTRWKIMENSSDKILEKDYRDT